MGCPRPLLRAAATLATTCMGCGLVSGVDQLQEVDCVGACVDAQTSQDSGVVGRRDAGWFGFGDGGFGYGYDGGFGYGYEGGFGQDAATVSSRYAAAVLADGPIGYWRLGDATGAAICRDASGHGHDGVLTGGASLGAAGALANDSDTAASFDGTDGIIDVGPSFAFVGDAPFTWEIWVKPKTLDGNYRSFLSSMTYATSGAPIDGTYMVAYSASGDTFGFERYYGGSPSTLAIDTPGLATGTWTYVVCTSDASGLGSVYMNGAVVATEVRKGTLGTYVAEALIGQYFKGQLDEVAFYDRALAASAVQAHWLAATTP